MRNSTTKPLIQKLGQLQAQLQHLPLTDEEEYPLRWRFTRRFAGEVIQDLEHLLMETGTEPSELVQNREEQ